ncbi:class I SAM-dependent methyltransferase [Thermoflavifilum thermophilum]|uniref:Methyltransferase domain-containing protein n=1 Tax=Thermoflavifilum thermophilum TaxID=1393122 RepID=A0A1I7NEP2_9BACT|nr:class I SAM-dependent methyltransferase [Thermoflavifilum thermophilum]SFV33016.1 Methyltransferase domain-containing protein [Thermoflavifilum thermophilum]
MKIRNPESRYDLKLKRKYKVLEVGGGNDPHPRSNVIVDKYSGDKNYHRSGNLKILKHQQFIEADGESLPFCDNSFDYVICIHVLEHVEHPDKFMKEQFRVASRGYLETPSLIGEYLAPRDSHKWVSLEIDEKIVMYEKEKIGFKKTFDFGELFLHYLPKNSLPFKLVQRTINNLLTINYEWENSIEILINPDNEEYLRVFTTPWDIEICERVFKKRNKAEELIKTISATKNIIKLFTKNKLFIMK